MYWGYNSSRGYLSSGFRPPSRDVKITKMFFMGFNSLATVNSVVFLGLCAVYASDPIPNNVYP